MIFLKISMIDVSLCIQFLFFQDTWFHKTNSLNAGLQHFSDRIKINKSIFSDTLFFGIETIHPLGM